MLANATMVIYKTGGGYMYIGVPVVKPDIYSDIHPVCNRSGAVRWPPGHIFTE